MNWLAELEDKVAQVRSALDELRKENRALRSKVRRLEQKKGSAAPDAAAAAWAEERDEIRRRVAALVERLEELAGSPDLL